MMTALALSFVLPSLLRKENSASKEQTKNTLAQRDILNLEVLRDQLRELDTDLQLGTIDAIGYQSARQDLERRVVTEVQDKPIQVERRVQSRTTAVVITLVIPIVAGALFHFLGMPKLGADAQITDAEEQPPSVTPQQIEGMVTKLAEKLKANPNDANGWRMLIRSYKTMQRYDEAVEAYKHLVPLIPNDADILTDYAMTLALTSNRKLSGEPEKLINRALEIDSKNVQALALSGSVAFEKKDYEKAISTWRLILAVVPSDSDIARTITGSISKAEALAKENTSLSKLGNVN